MRRLQKRLIEVLNEFLEPIREKRKFYEEKEDLISKILIDGNKKTKKEAEKTMKLVKEAMHCDYKRLLREV